MSSDGRADYGHDDKTARQTKSRFSDIISDNPSRGGGPLVITM